MEERIIEFEKKISFLEHSVEELTDLANDQHKQIEQLKERIQSLSDQRSGEKLVKDIDEEQPPPHY